MDRLGGFVKTESLAAARHEHVGLAFALDDDMGDGKPRRNDGRGLRLARDEHREDGVAIHVKPLRQDARDPVEELPQRRGFREIQYLALLDNAVESVLNDIVALAEQELQLGTERRTGDLARRDALDHVDQRALPPHARPSVDEVPDEAGEDEAARDRQRHEPHLDDQEEVRRNRDHLQPGVERRAERGPVGGDTALAHEDQRDVVHHEEHEQQRRGGLDKVLYPEGENHGDHERGSHEHPDGRRSEPEAYPRKELREQIIAAHRQRLARGGKQGGVARRDER